MAVTQVRLWYVKGLDPASRDRSGTPWKRKVTCRCCGRVMLSWDWGRAQAWADEHARSHNA